VFQYRKKNQRVLNDGVSASWINDDGLLAIRVSAMEGAKKLLDGIVSSMMEGEKDKGLLRKGVSATKRAKQLLDGIVSEVDN
jgi:hypothetical protein